MIIEKKKLLHRWFSRKFFLSCFRLHRREKELRGVVFDRVEEGLRHQLNDAENAVLLFGVSHDEMRRFADDWFMSYADLDITLSFCSS